MYLTLCRSLLSSLECRLETVEESCCPVPPTKATLTSTSNHAQAHVASRHTRIGTAHSDTMTLSDLDIPLAGVAAAEKFHPTHGKGPRKKTNPNPLNKTPPRMKYAGFMGTDLLSGSSGTGSDLDGHTLSCSLELMSDFDGK